MPASNERRVLSKWLSFILIGQTGVRHRTVDSSASHDAHTLRPRSESATAPGHAAADTPPPKRHSQGVSVSEHELQQHEQQQEQDRLHYFAQTVADYPDEFFEAQDDAVPILRHPYYNELTEDLGVIAETLLEEEEGVAEQEGLGGLETDWEQQPSLGDAKDTPDADVPARPGESQVIVDRVVSPSIIPLVAVDIHQTHLEPPKDAHPSLDDERADYEEDTCHINYALLRRYLETLSGSTFASAAPHPSNDRFAFYSSRTGFVRAETLQDISPHNIIQVMQSGVFWLDICAPSALELKVFGEVFKMHPLTLEDIQLDDVREKCDVLGDYFAVCLKAFEAKTNKMDYTDPINLYVLCAGKACVVSIHHQPLHFSQTIVKRIRLLSARTGLSTDWITYGIMDDVIDSFSPAIYESECEVELIDDACMLPQVAVEMKKMAESEPNHQDAGSMFHRITACRKNLILLTRLVSAKNEAVRSVLKICASQLSEDALVYLNDLQEHVHMMEQSLKHQEDALSRAYSNYLAHISIETSHTSNRMSRVMKTLSAFAAVTTPCTVVSCLLGMNLRGPFWPYGSDNSGPGSGSGGPYDFVLVVTFILSVTVLLVYVGKRNDWF